MQYKLLAISALAATSFAQGNEQQASQSELLSIVSVLQTALPSTLIQEYLTNSAAVSSELASDFSAGQYPDWFTALPTNVQTYLVPAGNGVANATGSSTPHISAAPTNSMNSTGNSTLPRTSRTPSISRTTGGSSSSSSSSSSGSGAQSSSGSGSSSSTGGASMPTAIMGMGLAGAVGLVGVLAL